MSRKLLLAFMGCLGAYALVHAATVNLAWDAPVWPPDKIPLPLLNYILARDSTEIARPQATSYRDTVEPGTYTYTVRALYDGGLEVGGLLSVESNAVVVNAGVPTPPSSATTFTCQFVPAAVPTFTCQALDSTPAGPYPLRPVGSITVSAVDSQDHGYEAARAVDGNPGTFWHTQWQAAAPPLPHSLTLDLGAVLWCDGVRYVARQDGNTNGTITSYRLEESSDLVTWATVTSGTWALDSSEKVARFAAIKTRYVRLVALVSNGSPYASAAEVGVFATPVP